jgi:hypothetical protein
MAPEVLICLSSLTKDQDTSNRGGEAFHVIVKVLRISDEVIQQDRHSWLSQPL